MDLQESVRLIVKNFPSSDKHTIYDTDSKGKEFCEITIPNSNDENMPITVTINESGCKVSCGYISDITGDKEIGIDNAISAINDIIEDKIILCAGFKTEDDVEFCQAYFTRIFAITGREDDMSDEYDGFLATLQKPLNPVTSIFAFYKGIFIIRNYSRTLYLKIHR